MVHTRLSQKSKFNNLSQWLEPGMNYNVPTWHLLRLRKSMYWSITKDVENGATYVCIIMAVIVYDHEIFYDFFKEFILSQSV